MLYFILKISKRFFSFQLLAIQNQISQKERKGKDKYSTLNLKSYADWANSVVLSYLLNIDTGYSTGNLIVFQNALMSHKFVMYVLSTVNVSVSHCHL